MLREKVLSVLAFFGLIKHGTISHSTGYYCDIARYDFRIVSHRIVHSGQVILSQKSIKRIQKKNSFDSQLVHIHERLAEKT